MNKYINRNSVIIIILMTMILSGIIYLCTGCNQQIIDMDYEYDKIICDYNGNKFELQVDKWTDYEGEQIQVKSNGKTYLLSANNCYMVKE